MRLARRKGKENYDVAWASNAVTKVFGGAAFLFGTATVISGGNALLVMHRIFEPPGRIVPFVLYFNFAAGFAYIVTGIELILRRRWALAFAGVVAVATTIVSVGLGVWIFVGNAHEMRTVIAMSLRAEFWFTASFASAIGYRVRSTASAGQRQFVIKPPLLRRPGNATSSKRQSAVA